MPPDALVTFLLARLAEDEARAPAAAPTDCPCEAGGAPPPVLHDVHGKQQVVHMYQALPWSTPDEVVAREQVRVLLEELAQDYADHRDHRADWLF